MIQHTILVPIVRDGDRQPHSDAAWAAWHNYLMETCYGYTITGYAYGKWGETDDRSSVYVVSHDRDVSKGIAAMVKQCFDQRAVYIATCNAEIL